MAWDLLLLPAPTVDSTPLLHTKAKGTHTALLPFWAWYPLMRPRGLHMAIQWYHRRSVWCQDHNGRYFSSWNDLTVKKPASKSSAVSAQEGGILYWPACWVAYKRKPGRAQSLVCSQWWTPPHPSWTQPELHHLDTVCWISKFPIVNSVIFLEHALINRGELISINQANLNTPLSSQRAPLKWARPFPSIRQTWARPFQVSAPLSSERAPFHQSGKLERAPLKRALPFLSIKQWIKNLEWMEEWPNRDQLPETERGLTHFSSACLLPF